MHTAEYWIETLRLRAHPEGGSFAESYRATEAIAAAHLPARYGDARPFSTAIYFLLRAGEISALHRLRSDELWHFYAGSALEVSAIAPAGGLHTLRLGAGPERGERFQGTVAAGCWFGSRLVSQEPGAYALVGCTVAPGFDFADFELAERAALVREYPQHRALIERLTH